MSRVLFLAVLLAAGAASGGSMTMLLDYSDAGEFGFSRYSGYDRIEWEGGECFSAPGQPLLPSRAYAVVVPPDAGNVTVSATVLESVRLGTGFYIQPAAVPRPFSAAGMPEIICPDPAIYDSDAAWPSDAVVSMHDGRKCGFRLAGFRICPWTWNPADGSLELAIRMEVAVEWEEGGSAPILSPSQIEAASARLSEWVANPLDIPAFSPPSLQPDAPVDYLVITSSDYSDSFAQFAAFKNGTGLVTEMVFISDILATTPGYDNAEKLRNYIKNRYLNDGLEYVLLAGDQTIIPVRNVALECEGWSDNAPADLYFSDLDGTWDANGDHSYGQPEDDLDLYSDVAVGRALFDTPGEAALFVQRSIMYQSSPPSGAWQTRAMLCGAGLFPGYTGAKVCDSIAVNLPAGWEINKAYELPSIQDGFTTHIAIINSGTAWNHYAGHGNTAGIYWQSSPTEMMTNSIAQGLYNGNMAGIHHSIGCHPGAFHSGECCAEALWHNPGGGASSVMFNTSYGWEGYLPEMGVSEWMCVYLTEEVFQLSNGIIGSAFATAKDRRVPLWSGGHDRELYCIMDWCAFHDPTLPVIGGGTGVEGRETVPPAGGMTPLLGTPCPNPATTGDMVRVPAAFGGGSATLEVFDLSGRIVLTIPVDSPGEAQLVPEGCDGAMPPGVYLLRLSNSTGSDTSRLVVLAGSR